MDLVKQREAVMTGITHNNCPMWEWQYLGSAMKTSVITVYEAVTPTVCEFLCQTSTNCSSVLEDVKTASDTSIRCTLYSYPFIEEAKGSNGRRLVKYTSCYGTLTLFFFFIN